MSASAEFEQQTIVTGLKLLWVMSYSSSECNQSTPLKVGGGEQRKGMGFRFKRLSWHPASNQVDERMYYHFDGLRMSSILFAVTRKGEFQSGPGDELIRRYYSILPSTGVVVQ